MINVVDVDYRYCYCFYRDTVGYICSNYSNQEIAAHSKNATSIMILDPE